MMKVDKEEKNLQNLQKEIKIIKGHKRVKSPLPEKGLKRITPCVP